MTTNINELFNMLLNRNEKYNLLSANNVEKDTLNLIFSVKIGNKMVWEDTSALFRINEYWAIYRESNKTYNYIYLKLASNVVKGKSIINGAYSLIPIA